MVNKRAMKETEFQMIIKQYEKLVFSICYQLVRDYQEAQNLAQETFLSAFTHIDDCTTENYKAWLARIASNKAKDYLKSAYARRVQLHEETEQEANVVSIEFAPEKILLEGEGYENLKQKIHSLKEPYLKVSILYFLEEKSMEEISKILNRPKKTVQTQISRAKGLLQKIIGKGD